MTAEIIEFPYKEVSFDPAVYSEVPAVILILPVVRVERESYEELRAKVRRDHYALVSEETEERVRETMMKLYEPGAAGFAWPWGHDAD